MKILALYLRLSLEDGEDNESNSITNQRMLIKEFLQRQPEFDDYQIREYCDDGYSGTNFNRPGITELLADVKRGLIAVIIVKDFSRFSRDYIEMGSYLDQIFPFMGVRFLSVVDRYDSNNHPGSTLEIDDAFKTLLNDLYCKDISIKVKSAFNTKCANGEYVFGQAPFGYEKIQGQKNQIRINEKEAEIVRYIFELSANGFSPVEIEKRLYEENVPTCSQMRGKRKKNDERVNCWGSDMVRKVLDNQFYLGEFIYHKGEVAAVGSDRIKPLPREEWISIPGHHEALVSRELFERAQYNKTGNSTKRKHPKHPLTGKLYCGGCGYAMIYKRSVKGKEYRRFECRKHAQLQIESCCTYFNAEILEELVLTMLNKELMKIVDLQESKEAIKSSLKNRMDMLNAKIRDIKKRQGELEQGISKAYEEYAEGLIGVDEYKKKAKKTDLLLNKLEESSLRYKKDLTDTEKVYYDNLDDLKKILKYSQVSELTQEVADEFIHKIKVYKDKSVEIEWAFSFHAGSGEKDNVIELAMARKRISSL